MADIGYKLASGAFQVVVAATSTPTAPHHQEGITGEDLHDERKGISGGCWRSALLLSGPTACQAGTGLDCSAKPYVLL
jgi:hypothetical protein